MLGEIMKRIIFLCVVFSILAAVHLSSACVGRFVHIGISGNSNERLLAEMASLLISERTGSNVQIDVYKDSPDLYKAVKQGSVNVFFESTGRAADIIGKPKDSTHAQIKSEYRAKLNLNWLELFGSSVKYAPVLTTETLSTYPALPKLLNKLSGALTNDTYAKLVKSVESGDKPKKVAKDFLKSKKLI
jgi:glycine betaine/choline ABC-type transport system substrate-binding protein